MAEDICGSRIPHLKGKTVRRKIQHVEPFKIKSVPKTILDKYKEVAIFYDLVHTNGIGFLIIISRHIMFSTESMIETEKLITLQMGSCRYINYTYRVVSRSHICTMIVISNQYARK